MDALKKIYGLLPEKVQNWLKHNSLMVKIISVFYHNNIKLNATHTDNVVYLKINRDSSYSIQCISNWIEVASILGYNYYIICDNDDLKAKLIVKLGDKLDDDIFLKSMRKQLSSIVEKFYSGRWKNATYAHLTAFFHQELYNYKKAWMVDADDTQFMLDLEYVCKMMKNVENLAIEKRIDVISLDMWRSRTRGRHWTFGIVFVNAQNICSLFDKENGEWKEKYDIEEYNLDWYFSYLKDYSKLVIETFYVDNCMFIHWGNMINNPIGSSIVYWHDNIAEYPILKIFNHPLGTVSIADCIKVDIGSTKEMCEAYFEYELATSLYGFENWLDQPWKNNIQNIILR